MLPDILKKRCCPRFAKSVYPKAMGRSREAKANAAIAERHLKAALTCAVSKPTAGQKPMSYHIDFFSERLHLPI